MDYVGERPTEPERPTATSFQVATSFDQLVAEGERRGPNSGKADLIDLYRRWIAAQPPTHGQLYAAWFNLGVELGCAGDHEASAEAYGMALSHQPNFAAAAVNLGLHHERSGNTNAALWTWRRALQDSESRTSLLNHQARLLERAGQLDEAELLMLASLQTTPMQPDVIQHLIHIRQKMCKWPVLCDKKLALSADQLLQNCGPLGALALTDNVKTQVDICSGWISRKTTLSSVRLSPSDGYAHGRLRIGYLSSDFCRHAMSFLIAELFEQHDRSRFEVYGYCSTKEDQSEIRARVLASFDHRRSVAALSDEEVAHLIRQDEIDILIDLNGLTQGSRLQVLRYRPAPVQATYLGFIGPVPMPELDYMLCDDTVIPPATAGSYCPAPLRIAANYQANDSKRSAPFAATREQAGLPDDGFVFCCFSNHYKITPKMFACWMEILREVDGGILWLITDNRWSCKNLRSQAESAGIDPMRLRFADRVDPTAYMARLAAADLFLDTFPYNAGTIASDAIRMGLPLLTHCGESFASRMATSLLTSIGAEFGIADSTASYIQKAVVLATDVNAYAAYRQYFTADSWAATIGDTALFTRSLEDTLERIAVRQPAPNIP